MIYCEAMLVSILVLTLISAVYSDIKNGVIENKKIVLSSALSAATNMIYYVVFVQNYFVLFIVNLLAMSAVSVILYAYHIWTAGDSKLLITILLTIPGRFYFINYNGIVPGFLLLILIFGFAFIYISGETIYFWIKNKDWKKKIVWKRKIFWKENICAVLSCVALIFISDGIAVYFFADFINGNDITLMMINFIVIITIMNYQALRGLIATILSVIASAGLIIHRIIPLSFSAINYRSYVLLIAVLIIRFMAARYNYKEIPTSQVKQGMILSWGTVTGFMGSRVKGLPAITTEDLRSRLTKDEADSIARWESSKHGKDTIVIVRKIPFAVFIAVGVLIFLILEVK